MDLDSVSVHKHAKKELGQYPAILASHLVNNQYLFPRKRDQTVISQSALQTFAIIQLKCLPGSLPQGCLNSYVALHVTLGGVLPEKNLVGVCSELLETLTLFQIQPKI